MTSELGPRVSFVHDVQQGVCRLVALISRRRTRRLYGFDVLAVRAGSQEERTWLQFFEQVNVKWSARLGLPADAKKGLVRVSP